MFPKRFSTILLLGLIISVLSGCYHNEYVSESQVGLRYNAQGQLFEVVGAGFYSGGFWEDIAIVDISTHTTVWSDQSLPTSDKQIVGATIGITYRRNPNKESIAKMNQLYRRELVNEDDPGQADTALRDLVFNRAARAVKQTTSEFTLDEMLGTGSAEKDRASLAARLKETLEPMLSEAGIELIDIGFNDIEPSKTYLASLDAKAQAQAEAERAKTETFKLQQQLEQEKAQTAIELEKANRDQQIAKLDANVLDESPAKLELEKARIYASAMSDKDKVYFIQPGTDISLFFNAPGTPVVTK